MDNRFNNYNPFLEEDNVNVNETIMKAQELEKENEELITIVNQYNEMVNDKDLSTEENNELFINFLYNVLKGKYFLITKCEEDDVFQVKYLKRIVDGKEYNNIGVFLSMEHLSSFVLNYENYLEEDDSIVAMDFSSVSQIILNNDIIDGLTINPSNEDLYVSKNLIKKLIDCIDNNE